MLSSTLKSSCSMLFGVTKQSRFAGNLVAYRSLSDYPQPPITQGPGGQINKIPSDFEQATGREREELKAFAEGVEYFNRQPVQMKKGDGTFEKPVMVPSEMHDRIVGIVPKGQDQPIWFEIKDNGVYYVPELDLHFKLYNPHKH